MSDPAAAGRQRAMLLQSLLLSPVAGLNDVRILQPHALLRERFGLAGQDVVGEAALVGAEPGLDKVLVWQRPILRRAQLAWIAELRRRGYLVVVDFDDDPDTFPKMVARDYLTFRAVHAVQTSTAELARRIAPLNPEVAVFANQVATIPPWRPRPVEGPITLFFGALNRTPDVEPLIPALNRVLARFAPRLRIGVLHDQGVFDRLIGNKAFLPLRTHAAYLRLLDSIDIALLPLADTPANRCKSDLKFIEAASRGVAALASPVVYAETVRDGETGLIFRDEADFEAKLTALVADAALRHRLARAAYDYVARERRLADHVGRRLDWYRDLFRRYRAVDDALAARLAALAPEASADAD